LKAARESQEVRELLQLLEPDQIKAMSAAQEKGASPVITTLPLERYGFALSKQDYQDYLLMRYRWPLSGLPTTCACGKRFSVDHSQICHLGGFVNRRHDDIRDELTEELQKVFS
jgi:hypothetical protein